VQGSVSFQPGGTGDWVEATPNRTLTVGDNLWVDRDSRAELQIGSTAIRLGPQTSLTFMDVRDDVTQLRLSVGSLYFRVRHFDRDDNFEVDTPNLAFNITRPGQFRLDVNENGDQTLATVFHGEAEITGSGNSYRLMEGQQGTFAGTDQLSYDIAGIGRGDGFTDWSLSRDERYDRSRSRQYVSEEMTGYEDLDDYGQWRNVSGYGYVWSPTGVAGDWAPYRYGHWAYVSPWGWTWVEDEPWGFAPFHYGRWALISGGWCWVPGPVAVRPVYSPALVAFVGGSGFSVGVSVGGGGGVGWFPLAPGEVYVPWYRTSPRYVQNVNVTNTRVNVTQVTNVYNNVTVNKVTNVTYVNQKNVQAVTVVNRDTFVNARPVRNNMVRVDERQLASAQVTHQSVRDIQPQKQSVVGTARPIDRRPPAQVMNREVVATRQPVAMNRPAPIAGVERPAAPPPVRTVKAAPANEVQPLERGAKGTGRPNAGNEGNRPGAIGNRPNAPSPAAPENRPNATPRPGAPENRPNAPETRPNAPENRPNAPENRPNAPENRPGREVPRPGRPENPQPGNRPEAQPNEAPRPNQPGNREAAPPRPGAPENRGQPDNGRSGQPDNRPGPRPGNRPDQTPQQPQPNMGNRPEPTPPQQQQQQNNMGNRPEQQRQTPNMRPESRPETPNARPEPQAPTPQNRPEAAPRENPNRPNMEPRGGQPNPPAAREDRGPQNQNRPQAAPPQERNVPRPEAQPRNDNNRQQDQRRNDKNNNDQRDKDKNKPPQLR
jgi:hypothetical protein